MMQTKTTIISLSILSIMFFTQCCGTFEDDKLSLPLRPYVGNQLQVAGYYYCEKLSQGYAFYRNGVILELGGGYYSINELEENLIKYYNEPSLLNHKYRWGIFIIEGHNIKFERLYPGNINWAAFIREGVILNDTTFHITKSYRSNGTEHRAKDEIYRFRRFSPKPDSTNNFIR